jgi:hypothetical protein
MPGSIFRNVLEDHTSFCSLPCKQKQYTSSFHTSFTEGKNGKVGKLPTGDGKELPTLAKASQVADEENKAAQEASEKAQTNALKNSGTSSEAEDEAIRDGTKKSEDITDPLKKMQMTKFEEELESIMPKKKKEARCTPALPVPDYKANWKHIPETLFNRPHLPICSRSVRGDCPYYVDHKSNELRLKSDRDSEGGEASNESEEPAEEEESAAAQASLGSMAWPFNQTLLALLAPKPQLERYGRCTASACNIRCSFRQQRSSRSSQRHTCGHAFL